MSTHGLRSTDFWSGVMFVAIGLAAVALARHIPAGTAMRMGPGYFPTALGLLLAVIGAALCVRGLIRPGQTVEALTFGKPALIIGSVVVFGLLLTRLGLLGSMVVLVMASAMASRQFSWSTAVPLAIGLAAGCAIVFVWLLNLPIPILGTWIAD